MSRIDKMTDAELEKLLEENKHMREALSTIRNCRKALNNTAANVRGVLETLCDLADSVLDGD